MDLRDQDTGLGGKIVKKWQKSRRVRKVFLQGGLNIEI